MENGKLFAVAIFGEEPPNKWVYVLANGLEDLLRASK
jgi:hypothetical protein